MNETTLTLPIIHLNGSSARSLLEDNRNAYNALYDAQSVLCKASPHPRDYYVAEDEQAFYKAKAEHGDRIQALNKIMEDLDNIGAYLMTHIKD